MPETNPPADPMIVRLPLIKFYTTENGKTVGEVIGSTPVPPGMLNGQFLGPNGYTTDVSEATDFRGEAGKTIVEGETVEVVGPRGEAGQNGKSAYDLWLEAGNVGDVATFLASLVGGPGERGPKGETGIGQDGTNGVDGEDGADGSDGRDAELRVSNGFIQWRVAGGEWANLVSLDDLRGPRGLLGERGPKGEDGAPGRGITATSVNGAGNLLVTYTDGTVADLGRVVGATGVQGVPGNTGSTGRGIQSSAITNGRLVLTYTDGTTADVGAVVGPQGVAGTNGTNGTSFAVGNPTVTALTTAEKNGTAFQPRAGGPCMVNVTGAMTGLLNVSSAITVSISATQNGTYVPVSLFSLTLNLAGIGISDAATGAFLVPSGWWVKVTQTGVSLLANIAMNRIVWNV